MTRHLVVAGAQRCGTTYLHSILDAHPQITMAQPAHPEPKIFLSDEQTDRGADYYRRTWFAHARGEEVLGEKSTSYLEFDQAAVRARRMLGDLAVIVQLRNPIDRAISNWKFSRQHGLEQRPLAQALAQNLAGPLPWDSSRTSVSPFAYLERGRYADYLRPWLEVYGDRLRVQFLEEISHKTVREMFAFLELHDADLTQVDEVIGSPVNQSDGERPVLTAELEAALRDYFAGPDQQLSALLGRDLPWTGNPADPDQEKDT